MTVRTPSKLWIIVALLSVVAGQAYAEDERDRSKLCEDAVEEYQRMESTIAPLQAMLWDELAEAKDAKDLGAIGKILTLINRSRKTRKDHLKDYRERVESLRCSELD